MRVPAPLLIAAALLAGCGGGGDRRDEPPGLARAEAALEAGTPGEARREMARIPPGSFRTPELRLRAATALRKARDWAAAARLLEADAGDFRRSTAAALLRTEALLRSGALEEADRALGVLGTVGGRSQRVPVLLAMGTVARGRVGDAQRDLEEIVRGGTRDPDAWVLWAQASLLAPAEAERRLLEGLQAAEDRAPILKALGRLLLRTGDADRALDHLVEAVRALPWDREARLDLARARLAALRPEEAARALEELRALARDDPGDFGVALALAESVAETALRKSRAAGDNPAAAGKEFAEAIRLYEDLAARPAPDPATAVGVLLGLARLHVETIRADRPEDALKPGSRLLRAEEALRRAEELDPEGRLVDRNGLRLLAEVFYLRGRARRRAGVPGEDHTVAVGWYVKAVEAEPRHLEAPWDLAVLYYDFLRTPEFIRKAARLADRHVRERQARGLPPLEGENLRILAHLHELSAAGRGFEPGQDTPELPPKEKPQ